jgi:hypothetical protein
MIRDRVLRNLVVVGLVLTDVILGLTLIAWLVMGVGMSSGMMNGTTSMGLAVGSGLLALLVLGSVVATLLWAVRSPELPQS